MSDAAMGPWWDFIRTKTKEGVNMSRVRMLVYPLNDYTKAELVAHAKSALCGDDIRTITDTECVSLGFEPVDFWLIDNTTCLLMNYTNEGEWLGFDVVTEHIEKYTEMKHTLLKNSKLL
jgi:cation diffusion facilitator CzcD-associated flavoprotein CzcO